MDLNAFVLVLAVFIFQMIVLYFVSHTMINELYYLLYGIFKKKETAFSIIAFLLLPGTIVHEMSHFLMATILFLPVREIRIFPEWRQNNVRLGMVSYQKADIIRSVIIGIAPFFGAIGFFILIEAFGLFPTNHFVLNICMGYLICMISANMFSSKQDLVDLIYLVPIIIVFLTLYYLLNIKIMVTVPSEFIQKGTVILKSINFYITIALAVHLGVIILFKSFRSLFQR
ncbi:hypothetical protein A2334_03905 [Candidatus Roizmanbacteria bacterium RIFOXYB2_FULL_38_10]|uniref:Uncharacterized protein n=1 Tax=Candidatus Roizmanbacteria bacterium RIFOXYD1_FULL_38_12 TaxID=1802093 RepID=A0A1F7KZ74_9BACT|nr:MAG: hypothetical protein A3K47_00015 [Candidatus Roizmanbacteria bacterium RIFOXYA2_FULL_38_14]OGK63187.1 MAG: hypothetical protein A3K27_00015 [Candidatus Roizmanbacteria bacterium RIFOXYA1_FULL_37_12]OGK65033.1 MAG: hypothetical protein A3K38_00015 [Candidatus Roizmanbacteria bacterium RIFOXYB1_FULL_40_23]OGK68588.1 MAG: hypothetical protein A2334_03905 [Candidatus Roizmanbacteria bacterium RIFOXYB2_FULL_38_10]OGK69436.1 MAG: hypothetical protein A3K21_00015 [Candidatus Roizmanbacteria ba